MTQILCNKCKNAVLSESDEGFVCPSCNAHFSKDEENLLLGIQFYNNGDLDLCEDALMKALVKNSRSGEALVYKALCDAARFDEDARSFGDTYEKLLSAVSSADDSAVPELISVCDGEMKKYELRLTALHVKAFKDADAEGTKKEVEFILRLRDEALSFRAELTHIAEDFNLRNTSRLTLNLSKCFYVSYELANETGDEKLSKIKEDIASHTVFTGILSNDIKNLEIYYRCIVMFFEKSKAKYDFLMENAKKLAYLNGTLESGKYVNVASPAAAAEKLKAAAYGFFEESLKEYDDENADAPAVVLTLPEPEVIPETAEAAETSEESNAEEAAADESAEEENGEEVSDGEAPKAEETGAPEAETAESTEEAFGESAAEPADETAEEPCAEEAEEHSEEPAEEETGAEPEEEKYEEAVKEETAEEAEKAAESTAEEAPNADESDEADGTAVNTEETPSPAEAIENAAKKMMDEISEESAGIIDEIKSEPVDISSNSLAERIKKRGNTPPMPENVGESAAEDAIVEITEQETVEVTEITEEIKEEPNESPAEPTAEESAEEYKTTLKPKKKKKHIGLIVFIVAILAVLAFLGYKYVPGMISESKYKAAATLLEDKKFSDAEQAFLALGEYKDSHDKALECKYMRADALQQEDDYSAAAEIFASLGEYKDAVTRVLSCKYETAVKTLNDGNFDDAARLFEEIKDYGNSADMTKECSYKKALSLTENKKYTDAVDILSSLKDYSDAPEKLNEAKYLYVTEHLSKDDKTTVSYINELAKAKYRNSQDLKTKLLGAEDANTLKLAVNTSEDDLSTALTTASHTEQLYFHIIGGSDYYGKNITLSFTTQYGFTQTSTVVLSKDESDSFMTYPSSSTKNYTVVFSATAEDGTVLGTVNFTVS